MQTFLPYADFTLSASVLDRARLGKQRVETYQLLKGSWPNHPASKMWRGHEHALALYGIAICKEWISRGYQDTCFDKISAFLYHPNTGLPSWFGDSTFHRSHQSNLIRKLPNHYKNYFPDTPDNLPYVWPVPLVKKS